MYRIRLASCFALALTAVAAAAPTDTTGEFTPQLSPEAALRFGVEAYLYGYPLVLMDVTRGTMSNVAEPDLTHAPVNQFLHARRFATAGFSRVVSVNVDTLYSSAWVDLAAEPLILRLPDMAARYHLVQVMDAWTNNRASLGTRTSGNGAGDFALVGPAWSGVLPSGLARIDLPTPTAWLIGRIYSTGTAVDYAQVHALQDGMTLTPLSAFGQPYAPPLAVVDPDVDMQTPPPEQVQAMDAQAFFGKLADLMAINPPADADAPTLARLAQVGIAPGEPFELAALPPLVSAALAQSIAAGQARIASAASSLLTPANGWGYSLELGDWGVEYLARAAIARFGLGANSPQDAVYYFAAADRDRHPLHGAQRYVLRFRPGQSPPANAFWSVTLYDAEQSLVANPWDRYAIRSGDNLTVNADGSIEIYLQDDWPGLGRFNNWLPAPEGDFNLILRVYWPAKPVLNGTWLPPAVRRIDSNRAPRG